METLPELSPLDAFSPTTKYVVLTIWFVLFVLLFFFWRHCVKEDQWQSKSTSKERKIFKEDEIEGGANHEGSDDDAQLISSSGQGLLWFLVISAVFGLIALFVSSFSMSFLSNKFEYAQTLIGEAEDLNKTPNDRLVELVEKWPEIVEYQKSNGDADKFDALTGQVFKLWVYRIEEPHSIPLIHEYMDSCFDENADISGLENLMSVYPVFEREFVSEWQNAAYRNVYSQKDVCNPEAIFKTIGIH